MKLDPYEVAIDEILADADGDVRLALRTVLVQNVELELKLRSLEESTQERSSLLHAISKTIN